MLICQLTEQAKGLGDTVFFPELWLERMIQLVKEQLKYRAKGAPEEVITSRLEFSRCVMQFLQQSPGMADRVVQVLELPLSGGAAFGQSATNEDVHSLSSRATSSRSYCLGRVGRVMQVNDDMARVLHCVRDVVAAGEGNIDGFTAGKLDELLHMGSGAIKGRVHVFERAMLRGQEVITSTGYGRSSVKDSTYVLVRYGADVPYVARVLYFLHIASADAGMRDLHFAVVSFFQAMEPLQDDDLGTVYQARQEDWIPQEMEYPVHLDFIDCKLVYTKAHIQGGERIVFAPYTIYSGTGV